MSILKDSFIQYIIKFLKTKIEAKQDKLVSGTNIKTINGNSLLGSGDVSISGDSTGDVDEGRLVWSDNYAPMGTLLDNVIKIGGNNVLAFMPPSAITIEYSTDNGVTWLDYEVSDANKTRFVTPELGTYRLRLGKDLSSAPLINDRLRITFDFIAGGMRFTPSKIVIKLESLGNNDDFHTRISTERYANYNQDVWEDVADQRNTIPDWGTYRLTDSDWGFASVKYRARLRCEFYRTATSVHRTGITNMILMATKITNANNYAKTGHVYSLDIQQNATFPAAVTATKHITKGGTANQVTLGDGSLKAISELSPITDDDADILLDNHIHNINVNANGNDVNINVIESSKNGNTWETEDNDITIPLATTTSAGVMSKEDKAKLDGNISIEPDSGMPDFIGDFEYSDVDYEAIIDLTTVDWVDWVEGGLFVMNAEETWEEDNGDTSYHQCVVTFIYRANGCIPISIVNTNKMTAKMSGMVITINLTEGTGEIRFKQIKLI